MSYANGGHYGPESPQDGPSSPGGQRAYPQSYNDPTFSQRQPPPSNNRTLFWILGIVAFLAIGGAVACCGIGYFVIQTASTELAKQFRPQIQNSPEIREHIGEIQDMGLSVQAMQQAGEAGKMVFEVTGSKGSGQVFVDLARVEQGEYEGSFELLLPDGQRMPITGVQGGPGRADGEAPAADQVPPPDAPLAPPPADSDAPAEPDPDVPVEPAATETDAAAPVEQAS